jgi:hypothetical protein
MQRFYSDETLALTLNVYTKAKRSVCSVAVTGLAGDVIDLHSQFEVTNENNFNVGVGSFICRGTDANDVEGPKVVRATVMNCTPGMHHLVGRPANHDILPADGTFYYNLCLYGLSSSATSSTRIHAEDGYQFISALNLGQQSV